MKMLSLFWRAVRRVTPSAQGEERRVGTAEGDIPDLFRRAGLENVVAGALESRTEYAGFDDFWEPFTFAVGPSGQYLMSLPGEQQVAIHELCRAEVPDGPFSLTARAWYATGIVPIS